VALKGRRATFDERVAVCEAIARGHSPDLVADVHGFSRSSVFAWWRAYRERGAQALRTKKTRGPAARLGDEQLGRLYRLVAGSDPRQLSFGPALWTRGMIAELIRREFGVTLSLVTVGRVLERLGMSPQRPLHRAYQQDPERTRQWKQEVFPQIQARAKAEGAVIFFADEASVRTDYHAGTTWAPVGRTPVVATTGARRSVSMASAVSARGELHFTVQKGGINAEDFAVFCRKLMADAARPVFLILDNSRVHHAKIITRLAADSGGRLTLFFLPPYSPELNPDEWVWKNVKHDHAGRAAALSHDDLYAIATTALDRLRAAPDLVRRFFADPVLQYIRDCTA
jgi:transposase